MGHRIDHEPAMPAPAEQERRDRPDERERRHDAVSLAAKHPVERTAGERDRAHDETGDHGGIEPLRRGGRDLPAPHGSRK